MQDRPAFANPALVLLAVTLGTVLLIVPGRAAAARVRCGDTITRDTTLHADLSNCHKHGIRVGADGITLDLNGHSITGDGTPSSPGDCCDVGVVIEDHDRVVVKGGSIRRFQLGVGAFGLRHVRVQGISSSRNQFAGVVIVDASHGAVRRSSLSHNLNPDGDGVYVGHSDHIRIRGNTVRDNPTVGIHLDNHSTHNLVKGNLFSNNGPSISITSNRNEIRGNRVIGGAGIVVSAPGNGNVIAGNRISKASDSLAIERGRHNLVAGNVIVDGRGNGIRLGIGAPSIGGSHNTVRRNVVKRSQADGFHVYPKDGNSLLKRNVALANGDDGFDIRKDSTALIRNRALRNRDLGIKAVRRLAIAFGNVARGNGDPRQCRHVRCR